MLLHMNGNMLFSSERILFTVHNVLIDTLYTLHSLTAVCTRHVRAAVYNNVDFIVDNYVDNICTD